MADQASAAAPLGAVWLPDSEAWRPLDASSNQGTVPDTSWMIGFQLQVVCSFPPAAAFFFMTGCVLWAGRSFVEGKEGERAVSS